MNSFLIGFRDSKLLEELQGVLNPIVTYDQIMRTLSIAIRGLNEFRPLPAKNTALLTSLRKSEDLANQLKSKADAAIAKEHPDTVNSANDIKTEHLHYKIEIKTSVMGLLTGIEGLKMAINFLGDNQESLKLQLAKNTCLLLNNTLDKMINFANRIETLFEKLLADLKILIPNEFQ